MTTKRAPDFDLRRALLDPGFWPRARDASALLDLIVEEGDVAALAERALLHLGPTVRDASIARAALPSSGRGAVLRLLGRLNATTADPVITAALIAHLSDEDARVRRAAANALGKSRPAEAEATLAEALGRESDASARRAMVEALGKLGGETAMAELTGGAARETEARERARASLIVTRTLARKTPSTIAAHKAPPSPSRIALRCRAGLASLLLDELPAELGARLVREPPAGARIEARLASPLIDLFRARTLLSFGFLLEPRRTVGDDPTEAVVASLTSRPARELLHSLTEGPLRFRLDFRRGGKRRAAVWRVAEEVARRAPDLVNDPTESPWEAIVHEGSGLVQIELVPGIPDPRFTYRRRDVPAASHPTIAAALARIGGVEPNDVVWDPFVGSGLELCERALLGPYREIVGSDIDPAALEIARENLSSAGATSVTLIHGDAPTLQLPGLSPTLIVTNPPLGRRVQRGPNLGGILERFVLHAADVLAPGGRLVWISPFPQRTRQAAEERGLTLAMAQEVDMGGFAAEIQKFVVG